MLPNLETKHDMPSAMSQQGSGAKAKFALYRETLRATGPVSPGVMPSPRRICDNPFPATARATSTNNAEAPQYAFSRHGGIYRSDVVKTKTKSWGGTEPPPAGRPRAQAKERVGRTTPFSSSAMSSDRLFLDRVARQQSPSPLHRYRQNKLWTGG